MYKSFREMSDEERRRAEEELYMIAESARDKAYCPYSGISVGAALLTSTGRVYTGCNIENSAYSPSVCAERVALFKAVSEGDNSPVAIAVAGGKRRESASSPFPPCGVCRQVMTEFGSSDLRIILKEGDGVKSYTLSELLPHSFGKDNL